MNPPLVKYLRRGILANWSVYENGMAGLHDKTRITILSRKFNESDHDLYLTYSLTSFEEKIKKCEGLYLATREGEDIHKYSTIGLRPTCYAEIRLKLLSVIDENPDVMLYNLVDECNNFRRLIVDSNMVESNETQTSLIKKPEIDR
ncbi:unnamed protein product [Hymenolepis diminuta]|uniref:Uncharacterized protein n=1 Tax=Hymenolepis diminuta TaxID=6216 RepID=A0A564Z0H9_HYMDI|nr:unnamed protein product [Hymenolepis diminuta]VUZ53004.1 unnamed protein product [Hymenolepis diminuta]